MGHASSIGLGIMENIVNRRIFLLDGDGAMLMHMNFIFIRAQKNNTFFHLLLNNSCHDQLEDSPHL